jgi:hypothetical protein
VAELPALAGPAMGRTTAEIGDRIAELVASSDVPAADGSLLAAMASVDADLR